MTGPTHIVFAAASTLALVNATGASPSAACWLAVVLGSIAPDLDSRRSTISRPGFILERLLPSIVVKLLNSIGRLLATAVQCVFGHRGVLHWPITGVALFVTGVLLESAWLHWFAWGYLSHILADFCTLGGIPLFAPISTRMVSWSPIRTGSFLEATVCTLLCIFVCVVGYQQLPEDTRLRIGSYFAMVTPV